MGVLIKSKHFLTACLIHVMLVGCASNAILHDAISIPVGGDLTKEHIGTAVQSAIGESPYWRVVASPGAQVLQAKSSYGGLSEMVEISWDESVVKFTPLGVSEQSTMGYSKDARRFRVIRDSLVKSIRRELADKIEELQRLHLEPSRTVSVDTVAVGDSVEAVKAKLASYGVPVEQGSVRTHDGTEMPYFLVTYNGHPPNVGSEFVTFVFFNGAFVLNTLQDRTDTELLLFADYIHGLWEAKKISFRKYIEWKRDKWFQAKNIAPDVYDEEFYLYQLWQAERVDMKQSTLAEYHFLVKQKDREIAQARANQALAEEQRDLAKRTASYQAEMVSLQRQANIQQRRANNIAEAALLKGFSYRPTFPRTINCTSYTSFAGYSTTTTCY